MKAYGHLVPSTDQTESGYGIVSGIIRKRCPTRYISDVYYHFSPDTLSLQVVVDLYNAFIDDYYHLVYDYAASLLDIHKYIHNNRILAELLGKDAADKLYWIDRVSNRGWYNYKVVQGD